MKQKEELVFDNVIPLYVQLKSLLANKINQGVYSTSDKIPSEKELAATYGISRVTVRKAIEDLEKEGYIIRKKGKGTFVNKKNEFEKIIYFKGFTNSTIKNGMKASSEVLLKQIQRADKQLAEQLQIDNGDEVLYIQRIRKANDKAVILENNWFSLKRYGFLVNEDLTGSLYKILEGKGIFDVRPGVTTLELYCADALLSKTINVPLQTPFFYLKTIIYDQESVPIHVGRQFYLAEAYRFDL